MRRDIIDCAVLAVQFQSTHSLRSATVAYSSVIYPSGVSIHALLAECDKSRKLLPTLPRGFNPRTPCGVRPRSASAGKTSHGFQSTHSLRSATVAAVWAILPTGVSIHALLAECDDSQAPASWDYDVSIHALLAECDVIQNKKLVDKVSFNPRTPCGVRPDGGRVKVYLKGFNPRTPCGVRLALNCKCKCSTWFQSTHSLRSATRN